MLACSASNSLKRRCDGYCTFSPRAFAATVAKQYSAWPAGMLTYVWIVMVTCAGGGGGGAGGNTECGMGAGRCT